MALHNNESHAFSQMCGELSKIIKDFLDNNETYKRIQEYIKLANDNLDAFHKGICQFNSNYEHYKLLDVSLNRETLINRCVYEIRLYFRNDRGDRDSTCFGVDSFIIFLDRAGLVKDEE